MSCRASWFRMLLHKYAPFLFRQCSQGNYHWRWHRWCWCVYGYNGLALHDMKRNTFYRLAHDGCK
jgi:hypothetical protein